MKAVAKKGITLRAFSAAVQCSIKAEKEGEVPVGCVGVYRGRIIARDYNHTIRDKDPTSHAEMNVIRRISRMLSNERLNEVDLYVTLEPCAMCSGAIIQARIRKVHFLALDHRSFSLLDLLKDRRINHFSRWQYYSISEFGASERLKNFFQSKRSVDNDNGG